MRERLARAKDDPDNLVRIAGEDAAEQETPASLARSVLVDLLTQMSEQ